MRAVRSVAAGLAIWAAALGCGGDAPPEGDGEGIVRAISPAGDRITLEHGDVPGLMKAMTMEFALAEPAQADGLEVGDAVRFRLRHADGTYTVTELEAAEE